MLFSNGKQQVFVPGGTGNYATCPLPSPDHGNFLWQGLHGRITVDRTNALVLVQNPSSPNLGWTDTDTYYLLFPDPPSTGAGATFADVGEAILVIGGSFDNDIKTWIIRADVCLSCSPPSWPSVTSMQAGGDLKYSVT